MSILGDFGGPIALPLLRPTLLLLRALEPVRYRSAALCLLLLLRRSRILLLGEELLRFEGGDAAGSCVRMSVSGWFFFLMLMFLNVVGWNGTEEEGFGGKSPLVLGRKEGGKND